MTALENIATSHKSSSEFYFKKKKLRGEESKCQRLRDTLLDAMGSGWTGCTAMFGGGNKKSNSRSRRKAADLGKQAAETRVNNNFNAPASTANNNSGTPISTGQIVATTAATATTTCSSAGGGKKTGVVSFSKTGSAKLARKATMSVDTCVADSLDDGMLDKLCAIPSGMDRNEWLATQTLAMFDHVNALCGTMSDVCTPVTCNHMSYPGVSKASWVDEKGKRHHYSAMRYIDSVMSFCEGSRKNQSLFPTKYGASFSPDFESHCRRMTRLLWYCCGHLYTKHWEQLAILNLRPQFGLVLAHMSRLAKNYGLMESKEMTSLNNTLQQVRPSSHNPSSQSRPTKRQNSDHDSTQQPENAIFAAPPSNRWSQQVIRVPAMKSGSWGGQVQDPVMIGAPTNCNKCYAQTC
ncbi:mob1/phocein family domain-containing protein [Ditylenchus destructor]|nr:mob1/phocein family domain-containing protein [Ditylenchus destructor]